MKRTKEKAAETKELLYKATLTVCSKKGYKGTSLDDIAKEAGVTRGAIHWHFGNKHNLFIKTAERIKDKIGPVVEESARKGVPALVILKDIISKFFMYVFENNEFRDLINLSLRAKMSDDMVELREICIVSINNSKKFITRLIEKGMKEGEIKKNLNPEIISAAIISYITGSVSNWMFNPKLFPLKSGIDDYIDLIFEGIREKNSQ